LLLRKVPANENVKQALLESLQREKVDFVLMDVATTVSVLDLKEDRFIDALIDLFLKHKSPDVKRRAACSLAKLLDSTRFDLKKTVALELCNHVKCPEPEERKYVAEGFRFLKITTENEVWQSLLNLLDDTEEFVKKEAALALSELNRNQ